MIWVAVLVACAQALVGGNKAYQEAENAKFQMEGEAIKADYESKIAKLNAQGEAYAAITEQQKYVMQAAMQGIQDGAMMANETAVQAGSGVALNSASKYEVRANQNLMHQINMSNIGLNRIQALAQSRANMTNYMANSMVSQGKSTASSIIGASIDPGEARGAAMVSSALGSVFSYSAMYGALSATSSTPGAIATAGTAGAGAASSAAATSAGSAATSAAGTSAASASSASSSWFSFW